MVRSSPLKADTLLQSISVAMLLAVFSRVVAFGRGMLFARTLDPAELGTWALAINAVQVIGYFAVLGLPCGLTRYVDRHHREGTLGRFLLVACTRGLYPVLALCCLGLIFHRSLGYLLFDEAGTVILVVVTLGAVLATAMWSFAKSALQGLRLLRLESWIELFYNVSFLALAAVLLFAWRSDAVATGLAYLTITGLTAVILGWCVYRAVQGSAPEGATNGGRVEAGAWRGMLVYSLGTWGAGSLLLLWRSMDRYMLLHLGRNNTEETLSRIGDYFVASKLAEPLGIFAVLMGVILLPHAAHLWERKKEKEVTQLVRLATKVSALTLTLGGAALLLIHRVALSVLLGRVPEYASLVMAPVAVTVIAVALYYVVRCHLLCRERTWMITWVWFGAVILNAIMNTCLIPRYDLYGAVIASLISAQVAIFAIFWIATREGLATDTGCWLSCALPMVLLLPPQGLVIALGLALALILLTERILTAEEKQQIVLWIARKTSRAPEVHSAPS